MCLFKPCCLIGDVWYLLTRIPITLRRWEKGYFSRTHTVKDAQKWMYWCNFLHLSFQSGKTGMCLAIFRHWALKSGYCKQGNRSYVIPPHSLNVQPFIYVFWEKKSPVLGVEKSLVLEKNKGPDPQEGGEWSSPINLPETRSTHLSRSCAQLFTTWSQRVGKVEKGVLLLSLFHWFCLHGKFVMPFPAKLIRLGEMALSTHKAPAASSKP